jgi:hypothetical protein
MLSLELRTHFQELFGSEQSHAYTIAKATYSAFLIEDLRMCTGNRALHVNSNRL